MEPQFAKLNANTIQITKEVVPATVVETYVYNDLVHTLATLQQQKDDFNAQIDQQIADAQANVDAADQLGIEAVVDPTQTIASSQLEVK